MPCIPNIGKPVPFGKFVEIFPVYQVFGTEKKFRRDSLPAGPLRD
jgi:hypothetical protein